MLGYFTGLFGLKKKSPKLTGWDDWDVVNNDPVPEPEPKVSPTSNPDDKVKPDDSDVYFDEKDDEIYVVDPAADTPESDDPSVEPVPPTKREIKEFNWHDKMPSCVGPIEDQGTCGSCWAFSSSGLLADRFCIHSEGKITTRFSPQEMINCNYENFGCTGGYLMTTIDYL